MKVGTKSILFGAHQFIIHPIESKEYKLRLLILTI